MFTPRAQLTHANPSGKNSRVRCINPWVPYQKSHNKREGGLGQNYIPGCGFSGVSHAAGGPNNKLAPCSYIRSPFGMQVSMSGESEKLGGLNSSPACNKS